MYDWLNDSKNTSKAYLQSCANNRCECGHSADLAVDFRGIHGRVHVRAKVEQGRQVMIQGS